MAEQSKTCGTCMYRDDDGDCMVLAEVDLPMWWVDLSIEPVDADQCADACDAWYPLGVRHG